MSDSERVHVDVSVALVTDDNRRMLMTFNDSWGMFTLPMTRRRRGRQQNEPSTRAAIRAAAEALGVPVRLVEQRSQLRPALLQSGRQMVDKIYNYNVFHIEPHPDFTGRLQVRQPHLWLSPHLILSGVYEPISESARFILRAALEDFEIPTRLQHTSVLLIERDDPERGRQYLLRSSDDWGYSFPSKRWEPPTPAGPAALASAALAGAERVAREELGLEPATDVTLTPALTPEFTTHGVSETQAAPAFGVATQYIHSLFEATIRHDEKLRSDKPLAWVTPEEIRNLTTAGSHRVPGSLPAQAGRVSRTVYDVLLGLGKIAEIDPPIVLEDAAAWIKRIEGRLKHMSYEDES